MAASSRTRALQLPIPRSAMQVLPGLGLRRRAARAGSADESSRPPRLCTRYRLTACKLPRASCDIRPDQRTARRIAQHQHALRRGQRDVMADQRSPASPRLGRDPAAERPHRAERREVDRSRVSPIAASIRSNSRPAPRRQRRRRRPRVGQSITIIMPPPASPSAPSAAPASRLGRVGARAATPTNASSVSGSAVGRRRLDGCGGTCPATGQCAPASRAASSSTSVSTPASRHHSSALAARASSRYADLPPCDAPRVAALTRRSICRHR